MNQSLSKYFLGIGTKRLSEVEINHKKSNQHEFGSNKFCEVLGKERTFFKGKIVYLDDNPDNTIIEEVTFSWYDTRENQPHRSAEYRLYYTANPVVAKATPGDLLIIGKTIKNELLLIIAEQESTAEQQLMWLFNLQDVGYRYKIKSLITEDSELNFAEKLIIETLGIEIQEEAPDLLAELLKKFNGIFPTTAIFSEYARYTLRNEVSAIDEPDKTLISWLEREELLFRTLEKHFVSERLAQGFGDEGKDVDEFVSYSLSVHNRRKARAGYSFENHLAAIFKENHVAFSKGQKTERNNKPDFLFPGIKEYRDFSFETNLLIMLGVKTTAKDRWRQVLSEAERIKNKHLITLQPAISINQTEEMREQNLQLVIPQPIMASYTNSQQNKLINLSDFINMVVNFQP